MILWIVVAVLVFGWWVTSWYYQRIHSVRLRWWARPFAYAALVWVCRLPKWCERAQDHVTGV